MERSKKLILGGALIVFATYLIFMNDNQGRTKKYGRKNRNRRFRGDDMEQYDDKNETISSTDISGKALTIPPQRVSNFSGDSDFFNFTTQNMVVGQFFPERGIDGSGQTYIYPEGKMSDGYYVSGKVSYPEGTTFSF